MIETLDKHILVRIFSFLDQKSCAEVLPNVCKRFEQLYCNDVYFRNALMFQLNSSEETELYTVSNGYLAREATADTTSVVHLKQEQGRHFTPGNGRVVSTKYLRNGRDWILEETKTDFTEYFQIDAFALDKTQKFIQDQLKHNTSYDKIRFPTEKVDPIDPRELERYIEIYHLNYPFI